MKAERIEAVKAACASGLVKSGATGEALVRAQREADAIIEILEAKPAEEFQGFEGQAGLLRLIKSVFGQARAKAAESL